MNEERTLTNVLQDDLNKRLSANKPLIQKALTTIDVETRELRDFIVPSRQLKGNFNYFTDVNSIGLNIGEGLMPLHLNAVGQLTERFKIRNASAFMKEHASSPEQWQRHLASSVLNEYSQNNSPSRMMLRAVSGTIKGALSTSYKRLDSAKIFSVFIKKVIDAGAVITSALAGETRMYIEALFPNIIMVPTAKNGNVGVAFGMQLSTSDFGNGALDLKAFILQGVCFNGLVLPSRIREVHLGAKLPEDIIFSDQTYKDDSNATAGAIGDMTSQMLEDGAIKRSAMMIQKSAEVVVDFDVKIKELPKLGMQKEECESLTSIFLANSPDDGIAGENTLWRLAQGVSAVANKSSEERKRALQEIAGKIISQAA